MLFVCYDNGYCMDDLYSGVVFVTFKIVLTVFKIELLSEYVSQNMFSMKTVYSYCNQLGLFQFVYKEC